MAATYFDLEGQVLPMEGAQTEECAECGMFCFPAEFHPTGACHLFRLLHDSHAVREHLRWIVEWGRDHATGGD